MAYLLKGPFQYYGNGYSILAASPLGMSAGAPQVASATIESNGTSLTIAFNKAVTFGAGGNTGFTFTGLSGGAATLSYASGDTTTSLVYTISRTVEIGETGGLLGYTQPGNGVEAVSGGDDLATFSNEPVTNNSTQDTTIPTLSTSVIPSSGNTITLAFSEAIVIGAGGNTGVTLSASGGAVTATYSSGDTTSTLVYSLSRLIETGETVTVSYTQPGNGLEDAAGNDVVTFSGASVTNGSSHVLLEPVQFSISPGGDNVLLIVTETWAIGAGGSGGFAVTGFSGGSVTLGTPIGEDTDTFAIPITNRLIGQSETGGLIAYTQPGNGIEDSDGNDMPSFSNFAVVVPNESAVDDIAPTLTSATVNGTSLSLTFSEAVTFGAGGNTGWTITPSGGAATLTYASGDGSTILVYTISRSIGPEETGTVAYTQPGNGVEDAAGNDLATIASRAFVNRLAVTRDKILTTTQKAILRGITA